MYLKASREGSWLPKLEASLSVSRRTQFNLYILHLPIFLMYALVVVLYLGTTKGNSVVIVQNIFVLLV